jgi:predicted RNA binding protein YcfA (HicA-like mRNA interferase family)
MKILSKNGFSIVGRKGSHIRMKKFTPEKIFIAIVPDHREIPIGTLKSIIRQAGLSEEEFRK